MDCMEIAQKYRNTHTHTHTFTHQHRFEFLGRREKCSIVSRSFHRYLPWREKPAAHLKAQCVQLPSESLSSPELPPRCVRHLPFPVLLPSSTDKGVCTVRQESTRYHSMSTHRQREHGACSFLPSFPSLPRHLDYLYSIIVIQMDCLSKLNPLSTLTHGK